MKRLHYVDILHVSRKYPYGEEWSSFIHVHHETPLSEVGPGYEVDPIEDLKPLCPNCHAIVHKRTPPYTPEEVREMIDGNG